jgi:hypothetical protein
VSELAVRQVDRAPLLEQLHHRLLFPRQQAADRVPARRLVVEAAVTATSLPAPRPLPVELQHAADPRQRPTCRHGPVDDVEQDGLGGPIDAGGDRTAHPQAAFPRNAASSMACSTIAVDSRSTSPRRRANSAFSPAVC